MLDLYISQSVASCQDGCSCGMQRGLSGSERDSRSGLRLPSFCSKWNPASQSASRELCK